jgi:type II secretory pathway pseudopilin PulG
MELLVVLLIIGILSTVALRTIDATRNRSLFDQTTKEMNKLVQAIVGNPDLTYDGRRVDFGFYGDMETLPGDLRELVVSTGDPAWHGPYLKLTHAGDTASYLYDGWGFPYTLNSSGEISSPGNGNQMTVKVVDDLSQLSDNVIAGTITDIDGAAPGTQSMGIFNVRMDYNNPGENPLPAIVIPDPSGFYEISNTPAGGSWKVPIGLHKLVATAAGESLIRYVTVVPRSKTIVDFKFTSSFWNKLKMVGTPTLTPDSKGFLIKVVNGQQQDVTVSSINFLLTSAALYMRDFRIESDHCGTPLPSGAPGFGPGDTVNFTASLTIPPNDLVELAFADFHVDSLGGDTNVVVTGNTFAFRFSDGSEITVSP